MRFLIPILVLMVFGSIFVNAYAETQIPFWVKQRIKWWGSNNIDDDGFAKSLLWYSVKEKIKISIVNGPTQIPQSLKDDAKNWDAGKISDTDFFNKIKSNLSNGSIKFSSMIKFNINDYNEKEYSKYSPLFRTFAYKKDFIVDNKKLTPIDIQFEKLMNQTKNYEKISSNGKNSIVIFPIFTATAYGEPGFYTYYRGECDTDCLTKKIQYTRPYGYSGSSNAVKVLKLLGYKTTTDIEVDKNPEMLTRYKKIIVLHNEYVTQREFDAITNHPHVLYLYPNALYAKITTNYQNDTITLVRGHNYPSKEIRNGFNWKYDNSNDEYDNLCSNWKFIEIKNGKMLNCYPENIIFSDFSLLKAIKDY